MTATDRSRSSFPPTARPRTSSPRSRTSPARSNRWASTHEILVIDDGSDDGTGALVTANLARFPNVRLLINERNLGFGWSYRRGVEAAALDHIVMVHGDNAWGHDTLREFFSHVGEADIIIGYTRDMWRQRDVARGP